MRTVQQVSTGVAIRVLDGQDEARADDAVGETPPPQSEEGGVIRSGRWTPWELVLARSVEMDTLNGRPVWSVTIPFSCHRAKAMSMTRLRVWKRGMS